MTKKQALNYLRSSGFSKEQIKAVVDALQGSPTKNDLAVDCISRQAVIDSLYDWSNHSMTDAETWHLRQVIGDIKSMPSVTPQIRPKGHWIVQPSNKEQGERDFIWWKCSECGQVIFSETEHDRLEFHSFCGRCGSDNREVVEE